MVDNVTLNPGSGGANFATDEIAGIHHQRVKVQFGVDGSATDVSASNPLPISDNGASITVDGTIDLGATDNAVLDQIEVNTSYGDATGGGLEATALRVTIASDSTGVLSIDDNGASITVDGTIDLGATDNAVLDSIDAAVNGTLAVDIDATTAIATEDAVAAANPQGIYVSTVRDDEVGSTAIASADGDVQALRSDMFGALKTTQIADATSEIKYGVINDSTSGDNQLEAAAGAGIKRRILSVFMVSDGTVDARFESGAGGTAMTGQLPLVANSGFVLPFNPGGWFETGDNATLNLELSAAIGVHGSYSYVEV